MPWKITAVALPLVVMGASVAHAALPPSWQSAKEIGAIVEDQRVHDALKYEEPILSIRLEEPLSDNRVYVVSTARCTLLVAVAYKPAKKGMVGPAQFDLKLDGAECQ
jgi:hypothetical protein